MLYAEMTGEWLFILFTATWPRNFMAVHETGHFRGSGLGVGLVVVDRAHPKGLSAVASLPAMLRDQVWSRLLGSVAYRTAPSTERLALSSLSKVVTRASVVRSRAAMLAALD